MNRILPVIVINFIWSLFPSDAGCQMALKKVSFIPHWFPQAQFAGYYVAYETGIYKKYGIDLNIIPGGPDNPSITALEQAKADFATTWLTTAIQKYDHGTDLINIAQIVPRSSLMLIAKKSSGIEKPEDVNGKKIGVWGGDFRLQPLAFIKKFSLNVRVINQPYSVNLFLRDGVDVTSAMWYNEYHVILNSGYNPDELTTFFFYDYDLNFPEDGLYCMKKTYTADPELCRNFVNASIEGWNYAFDHPDLAIDIIMKYMRLSHLGTNRPHQRWMLDRMKDVIFIPGMPVGVLNEHDFMNVSGELKKSGLIKDIPDFNAFYKECVTYVKE